MFSQASVYPQGGAWSEGFGEVHVWSVGGGVGVWSCLREVGVWYGLGEGAGAWSGGWCLFFFGVSGLRREGVRSGLRGGSQTAPPRNGYCLGRHASYWNVFLFQPKFIST